MQLVLRQLSSPLQQQRPETKQNAYSECLSEKKGIFIYTFTLLIIFSWMLAKPPNRFYFRILIVIHETEPNCIRQSP